MSQIWLLQWSALCELKEHSVQQQVLELNDKEFHADQIHKQQTTHTIWQKMHDDLFLAKDCSYLQIFCENDHLIVEDVHVLHLRHVLYDDKEHLWAVNRLFITEVNQNQNNFKKLDHIVLIKLHDDEISVWTVFLMMTYHLILDVLVDIDVHHDLKIFLIECVHRIVSEEIMWTLMMMIVVNVPQLCCNEKDIHSFSEDELLLHDSLHSFYKSFYHVFCLNDFHSFFLDD